MNKNIPHPADGFKYALGGTPDAWNTLGTEARDYRRALTAQLSAGNTLTQAEASILQAVAACARIERLAAQAVEGGRA